MFNRRSILKATAALPFAKFAFANDEVPRLIHPGEFVVNRSYLNELDAWFISPIFHQKCKKAWFEVRYRLLGSVPSPPKKHHIWRTHEHDLDYKPLREVHDYLRGLNDEELKHIFMVGEFPVVNYCHFSSNWKHCNVYRVNETDDKKFETFSFSSSNIKMGNA